MNEEWIRNYLNGCTKEAVIELYLQMRFERDLFMQIADDDNWKWIPCSEKMPEDGVEDEYLLTWRERWGEEPWDYHVDCCTYRCVADKSNPYMLGRWEFNWDFWEGQKCEPVAWMHLPKPYKED